MSGQADRDPRLEFRGEGSIQFFYIVGIGIIGVAAIILLVAFLRGTGPLVLVGFGWILSGILLVALASIFKGLYQRQDLGLDQQTEILSDLSKVENSLLTDDEDSRDRSSPGSTKTRCPACGYELDDSLGRQTECPHCGRMLD